MSEKTASGFSSSVTFIYLRQQWWFRKSDRENSEFSNPVPDTRLCLCKFEDYRTLRISDEIVQRGSTLQISGVLDRFIWDKLIHVFSHSLQKYQLSYSYANHHASVGETKMSTTLSLFPRVERITELKSANVPLVLGPSTACASSFSKFSPQSNKPQSNCCLRDVPGE